MFKWLKKINVQKMRITLLECGPQKRKFGAVNLSFFQIGVFFERILDQECLSFATISYIFIDILN